MYTKIDFNTKKALREAVIAGKVVDTYEEGPFPAKTEGWVALEGPHYPRPHSWYAEALLHDGKVIKVK